MQPIVPNTPPNSLVWRIVHFPITLLFIGVATFAGAGALSRQVRGLFPAQKESPLAIVYALIVAGIFIAAYVLFVRWVERRPVFEFGLRRWYRELGVGFGAGFVLFSIVIGIIAALGGYSIVGINPASALYPAIALSIISGVTEEILLRGLLFRLVEQLTGSWIALILSAALFGAGHLSNPHATWFAGLAIALEAGVMLAALYMVTRRLWAAIGLHAAWNFTQGGIYGVAVSGFDTSGLIRPQFAGSELLTGGAFGAEASLSALLVNVAFGIGLLVIAQRTGRVIAPLWVRCRADQGKGVQE